MQLQVFGFAIQNLLQIEFRFRLFTLIVFANDYRMTQLGDLRETPGELEHLKGSELRAIVRDHEFTGTVHGPEDIDNARVRNRNYSAAQESDVVAEVSRFQKLIQIDGDEARGRRISCRGRITFGWGRHRVLRHWRRRRKHRGTRRGAFRNFHSRGSAS